MTYRDGTTHNALTGGTWQLDARRVWVWVPDYDTVTNDFTANTGLVP